MASLMHANLPSEDEEDDDYDPSMDPTGEKDPSKQGKGRKRRGLPGAEDDGAAADAADAPDPAPTAARTAAAPDEDEILTPAQTAKKAKISAMWEQLHQTSTGSANKLSRNTISLASLCSNTDPKKKTNTDVLWMRNLGITSSKPSALQQGFNTPAPSKTAAAAAATDGDAAAPSTAPPALGAPSISSSSGLEAPPAAAAAAAAAGDGDHQQQQQQQQQSDKASSIRAAAAAALAAAREGATGGVVKSYNKVTLTETRRFAGKDIQVEVQVDKDSKEAKRAAERASAAASGLDSFLRQIESKKKVTVLDKSKMDWQDFKQADNDVQEELEAHRRSDKQYLDRQDFLKRTELREYEIERDKRLASDVRLRGRL